MKQTMIATVLGLALMPLTFAAQTPAKPADKSANTNATTSTDTTKPVKKHTKKHAKKPAEKAPATNAAPAAPAPAQK